MFIDTRVGKPSPAEARGGPCVLLVDDETTVRTALRRFFLRLGWTVCEAESGEGARAWLTRADESEVDLVICDLRMPRVSGQALFTWVCEERPLASSRFVFTTGDTLSDDAEAFLRAAGRPVLAKPFELQELLEVVTSVCGTARAA